MVNDGSHSLFAVRYFSSLPGHALEDGFERGGYRVAVEVLAGDGGGAASGVGQGLWIGEQGTAPI